LIVLKNGAESVPFFYFMGMKTLFINRHAKSSWDHPDLSDFDRPLNNRGLKDAPEMGKRLSHKNEGIELFVSSTANRAITTARLMATEMKYPHEKILEIAEIYHASSRTLLNIVNQFDDSLSKIIIFGHNPGFTDLAENLTGEYLGNIPTCGICKVEFQTDSWTEIGFDSGVLKYFDYPKNKA